MSKWEPIATAQHVRYNTRAELRMASGRVYRATWQFRGNGCAWWLEPGQARRSPIGLYDPVEWRMIAPGLVDDWKQAVKQAVRCCECGRTETETWGLKERRGKIYCERHLLNTPEKRAYEEQHVDPHS